MSLADKIVEQAGTKWDRTLNGAFSSVRERISKAQRFVFSPEAMGACHQLMETKPSSLLDVQPRCRAPFSLTWMEWGGDVPGRGFKDPGLEYTHEIAIPERFGCLLECLDETNRRFGASFFWNFERGKGPSSAAQSIQFCPLGVIINWHDEWQPMHRLNALSGPVDLDQQVKPMWHIAKFLNDEKERQALMKMNRQVVCAVSPYMRDFVEAVQKRTSFEKMEQYIQASSNDLVGEVKAVQGALCLLNSRNCVEIEQADLEKINRRRRKDCKKALLSYSTVKISLSRADQRIAARSGASEIELRQHIVRGHFKLRKSGVYWWRPYLRGNAKIGQVVRTGYEVAA